MLTLLPDSVMNKMHVIATVCYENRIFTLSGNDDRDDEAPGQEAQTATRTRRANEGLC